MGGGALISASPGLCMSERWKWINALLKLSLTMLMGRSCSSMTMAICLPSRSTSGERSTSCAASFRHAEKRVAAQSKRMRGVPLSNVLSRSVPTVFLGQVERTGHATQPE